MAGREAGWARGGSRWSQAVWGAAALLLLAPAVAMQFSEEMAWTTFDFALLGGLLGGLCLGFELAVRRTVDPAYRLAAGLALAAMVLLVLINGAVGVIGSEDEAANLLFAGVVAVAMAGAVAARFRAAGMSRAMAAAALAQALVPVAAWALWPAARDLTWSPQVLGLTGGFSAMWLVAAWLFRRAAARQGLDP